MAGRRATGSAMARLARKAASPRSARGADYETGATMQASSGGTARALLDGATSATPVTLAVAASEGERVRVRVSGHRARVVGNITANSEE